MIANELRSGNKFITHKGTVVTLSYFMPLIHRGEQQTALFFKEGGGAYTTSIERDQAIPIPLTPELLEQCGFEKTSDYQYRIQTGYYTTNFGKGETKRTKMILKKKLTYKYWFVVSPANGSIVLRYLHQLQNLYFALTGTELEIKM